MILVLYLAPYYGSIIENDKNYKNKTNDENDLGRNNLNSENETNDENDLESSHNLDSENETNDENDLESSHNLDSENELNDGNKLNGKNNEYDYSKDKSKFKNSVLLKYPIFTLVFLSVTFLMIFHNIFTGYMISFFENVGGNISDVALGNSIAAFLELPTMFLFAKFLKKVSAQKLLIIASIFYFLRSILVFTAQDTLGIYISITLQMLSFALMIPASVHITDELMREEDKYEGQAYMGVTQTIGIIFANLIGGNILQLYGVDFLTSLLLIISFLGCLFALSTVVANRRIKN